MPGNYCHNRLVISPFTYKSFYDREFFVWYLFEVIIKLKKFRGADLG